MAKKTRLLATFLAAGLIFVVLFSVLYIAVESKHDCIGEHCPICHRIQACENALHQLANGIAAAAVFFFEGYVVRCTVLRCAGAENLRTLVSLRVKLSD